MDYFNSTSSGMRASFKMFLEEKEKMNESSGENWQPCPNVPLRDQLLSVASAPRHNKLIAPVWILALLVLVNSVLAAPILGEADSKNVFSDAIIFKAKEYATNMGADFSDIDIFQSDAKYTGRVLAAAGYEYARSANGNLTRDANGCPIRLRKGITLFSNTAAVAFPDKISEGSGQPNTLWDSFFFVGYLADTFFHESLHYCFGLNLVLLGDGEAPIPANCGMVGVSKEDHAEMVGDVTGPLGEFRCEEFMIELETHSNLCAEAQAISGLITAKEGEKVQIANSGGDTFDIDQEINALKSILKGICNAAESLETHWKGEDPAKYAQECIEAHIEDVENGGPGLDPNGCAPSFPPSNYHPPSSGAGSGFDNDCPMEPCESCSGV